MKAVHTSTVISRPRTTCALAMAALLSLKASGLCAAAIDPFDGSTYANGGSGWQNNWSIQNDGGASKPATAGRSSTIPVVTNSTNYLTFTNTYDTNSSIYRQLNTTTKDYAGNFTISFDVRVDSFGTGATPAILYTETASFRTYPQTNTGGYGIRITKTGSTYYWDISDGNHSGTTASRNKTLAINAGQTYHFDIDMTPSNGTFGVMIDQQAYTNIGGTYGNGSRFGFRGTLANSTLQSFVSFNAVNGSALSIDNVSVTVPEPTTLTTAGGLAIASLTLRRRRA